MVTKRYCDCCGADINGSYQRLNIVYISNGCSDEDKGTFDLCWNCKHEALLFLNEQCKYHKLSKVSEAIENLET